jgi:type VI secretion system secreted protein Hcp
MAQTDYLLYIDGVQGETKQEGYANYIDIESWSFGGTNSGSFDVGGGGGSGKVSMQDFHYVCKNGKSTAQVFLKMVTKAHPANAKLVCRKGGGGDTTYPYYVVEFTNLTISSFQEGGSNGSDLLPHCQISFNFEEVKVSYSEQDQQGQVQECATAKYNQSTGVGTA